MREREGGANVGYNGWHDYSGSRPPEPTTLSEFEHDLELSEVGDYRSPRLPVVILPPKMTLFQRIVDWVLRKLFG